MEQRLAEIHIVSAKKLALRLFCTSSTIIPQEYKNEISEQLVSDLSEFALHARRVNELCNLPAKSFSNISKSRLNTTGYPAPVESNYHDAINRLIHGESYIVGYSIWEGKKIFLASENNVIAEYVKIKTKKKPFACVSIFGVSFCFLTDVLPYLKIYYPLIEF